MRKGIIGALAASLAAAAIPATAAEQLKGKTAWDFQFQSIDGSPLPLSKFEGNVLLVVNVASFCGFTPQYEGLQALHEKYKERGLTVVGVPSNDFGDQEPGDSKEIKKFCQGTYGITFPLTGKETLSGPKAHPFYAWARQDLGWLNAPKWNFHKYLVGRNGKLVTSFFSTTKPSSSKLVKAVEEQLAQGTMSKPK